MTGASRVSLSVAGTLSLSVEPLSFVRCYKVKGSTPRTSDEPFPVEHRGRRPPSENINNQHRGGESEHQSEGLG